MFTGSLTTMLLGVVIVLMAITVHELAHGLIAYRLGDPTAKNQGRLSLNPLKHLDPIGALLLFVVGFGWAKPVPVNPYYFEGDRNKGMMQVSVAGPAANLLLAFLLVIIYQITFRWHGGYYLNYFLTQGIVLNIYLAVFNLIPIPPLDGSKILAGLLPQDTAYKFLNTVEQYGFFILIILVMFNITGKIIGPIAQWLISLMLTVTGIFF